jgi:hypothetical protein
MKQFTLLMMLFAFGCSDAATSSWSALGCKHKVELYSGGQKVREWTSTGKVNNESESDGYYFCDVETKKLVRVSGTLVITQVE